jgi:hypothetical protein
MSYSEESDFNRWSKIKVSNGFYVTIKNWGKYKSEGYTPKCDPDFIAAQSKRFHQNSVRAIYKMGFGELFGVEGPVYYLFAQLLENPELNKDEVLDTYYSSAYGNASPEMKKFFTLLHERVKNINAMEVDWNDAELLDGKLPKNVKAEHKHLMTKRYPDKVLAELEKYILAAETAARLSEKDKLRLKVTRIEFDYLKNLAAVFNQYFYFIKNPDEENFQKLEKLVEKRTALVNSLFPEDAGLNTRIKPVGTISLFGKSTKGEILNGWGKNSELKEPFNWDFAYLKQLKVNPASRSITANIDNSVESNNAVESQILLDPDLTWKKDTLKENPTLLSCSYDKNYLKAAFLCKNTKNINNDIFTVTLSAHKSQQTILYFKFIGKKKNPVMFEFVKASGTNKRDLYLPYKSNTEAELKIIPQPETKSVIAECLIPLSLFGTDINPAGMQWYGNFSRQSRKLKVAAVWQSALNSSAPDKTNHALGKIVFADEKPSSEEEKSANMSLLFKSTFSLDNFDSWKNTPYIHGKVDPEKKEKLLSAMSGNISAEAAEPNNFTAVLVNSPDLANHQDSKGLPAVSNRLFRIININDHKDAGFQLKFKAAGKTDNFKLYISFRGNISGKPGIIDRRFAVSKEWQEKSQFITPPKGTNELYIAFILDRPGELQLDDIMISKK